MRLTLMMMMRMKMKTKDLMVSDTTAIKLIKKTKKIVIVYTFMQTCNIAESVFSNCLILLAFTEVQLEQKSVPTAVFGGLKDD